MKKEITLVGHVLGVSAIVRVNWGVIIVENFFWSLVLMLYVMEPYVLIMFKSLNIIHISSFWNHWSSFWQNTEIKMKPVRKLKNKIFLKQNRSSLNRLSLIKSFPIYNIKYLPEEISSTVRHLMLQKLSYLWANSERPLFKKWIKVFKQS